MSRLGSSVLILFLAVVALGGVYSAWRVDQSFVGESDFPGYYTAALLVRYGQSAQIYSGQSGVDPIEVPSDPHSFFARTAQAHGIRNVPLYDYPLTLADLLVPFTLLSPFSALLLWEATTALFLVGSGILLARLMGLRQPAQTAAVIALILFFRPTVAAFVYGQVSVLLLFLVVAGLYCCERGRSTQAGLWIAIAIAIKFTPLVLVIPLLAWRDWKTLRAVALGCLSILGVLLLLNGPEALSLYFFHRVPAMAHAFIDLTNLNLRTAAQVFWYGTDMVAPTLASLWAGRLLSLLVLLYAAWLIRARRSIHWSNSQRLIAASVFLLFSACVSPIAWRHAYVLAVLALLFLGRRIWQGRAHPLETALVLWFILALSTDKFDKWAWHFEDLGFSMLAMMPPLLGVALGLLELHRLRRERAEDDREEAIIVPSAISLSRDCSFRAKAAPFGIARGAG
ncbi:MAG: glycosyltransferase family 87 protein [Terracidiphilus sp.]